jgi:hypothetical protein
VILIDNPWFYSEALFHRLCCGFLLVTGVKVLYDSAIRPI